MKTIPFIFTIIIVLSIIGITLYYLKIKINDISGLALGIQAGATVILVIITAFYAFETHQSRISQERGFDKYIRELQESRKQEVRPNVYALFFWCQNLNKFFLVLKNVGVGPAFDIEATYSTTDNRGEKIKKTFKCGMLGVGKEKAYHTHFNSDYVKMKSLIKIDIVYKDSFGQIFTNSFEHSLRDAANNPIPTDFAEYRRKIEEGLYRHNIEIWMNNFLDTLANM